MATSVSPGGDVNTMTCIAAFITGVIVLVIVELVVLLHYIRRVLRQPRFMYPKAPVSSYKGENDFFEPSREGVMWVASLSSLELESAISKSVDQQQRNLKEQRSKKGHAKHGFMISPSKRHAKLVNRVLYLTASDGTESCISLEVYDVMAISSADVESKKWARKYPIKLQLKSSSVSNGGSICLLYFETSWEKEAWCATLRAAAKDCGPEDGFSKLRQEFADYICLLKGQFPTLFNHSTIWSNEAKAGAEASRKQVFWRKFLKKHSKSKHNGSSSKSLEASNNETFGKSQLESPRQSVAHGQTNRLRHVSSWSGPSGGESDNQVHTSQSHDGLGTESLRDKDYHKPGHEGVDVDDPFPTGLGEKVIDEGVLGWNLFFGRLFFDLYHSPSVVTALQRRIQKILSRVRTPGYIGPINCTHLDLGKAPPLVHRLRVLPVESSKAWILEAEVSYSGGVVFTFETRLDVRDSSSQETPVEAGIQTSLSGEAAADLLNKSLECVNDMDLVAEVRLDESQDKESTSGSGVAVLQIPVRVGRNEKPEPDSGNGNDNPEGTTNSGSKESGHKWWTSTGWRAMLSHVAEQVSQVPFSLSIRVVSLNGTLQLRMKPPPSDRVWFGFTSMPSLELSSEPSIGDHKFSTGPIVSFITERIKLLLRDTLVYPNLEDIYIPWMLSESDNWLGQSAAPFPWTPIRMGNESEQNAAGLSPRPQEHVDHISSSSDLSLEPSERLRDVPSSTSGVDAAEAEASSVPSSPTHDGHAKRSARMKMLSLGKKVGEKFEEKKRHLAEIMREKFEHQSVSGL